jgi:hypothetical protein
MEIYIHQAYLLSPASQRQSQADGHAAFAHAALAAHHHQLVANLLQGPGQLPFFLAFFLGMMSRITALASFGIFAAGLWIGSVRTFIHIQNSS